MHFLLQIVLHTAQTSDSKELDYEEHSFCSVGDVISCNGDSYGYQLAWNGQIGLSHVASMLGSNPAQSTLSF